MSEDVVFYHTSRKVNPRTNLIQAPSIFGIRTRSARFKDGQRIEDWVYQDPAMVQYRPMQTTTGLVNQVIDRTEITMKNGELRLKASDKFLIEGLREHESCLGSEANRLTNKRAMFFEYKPQEIVKNEIDNILALSKVVQKIDSLNTVPALIAWAKQFGLKYSPDQSLVSIKTDLILKVKQKPDKYLIPDNVETADMAAIISNWKDAGVITHWKGAGAEQRWKWGTAFQPDGYEKVIVSFDKDADEYEGLAEYLGKNTEIANLIKTIYESLF